MGTTVMPRPISSLSLSRAICRQVVTEYSHGAKIPFHSEPDGDEGRQKEWSGGIVLPSANRARESGPQNTRQWTDPIGSPAGFSKEDGAMRV